jgi:putative ABC transport system permease protein
MVTHNADIADKYADRIVRFEDGIIIDDTHPHDERPKPDSFSLIKTSMSFLTALSLSFNNILTKKGRTALTAFASSIGIIGIALILSLSTGFQDQIDEFQGDTLAEFPIIVTQQSIEVDREAMVSARREQADASVGFLDVDEVYPYDPSANLTVHKNIITEEYVDYVSAIDPQVVSSIGFVRLVNMNLLRSIDGNIQPISFGGGLGGGNGSVGGGVVSGMSEMGLSSYPTMLDTSSGSYLEKNYDLLSGAYPQNPTELVLVVDKQNRVNYNTLNHLGFKTEDVDAIHFSDIVGIEYKLIGNNDYYISTEHGTFMPNSDVQGMYDSEDNLTLTIVGIVRQNPDTRLALLSPGIAYNDDLSTIVIDRAMDSDVVKAQRESDFNIMSREPLTEDAKSTFISYLGGNAKPMMMMIYPQGFKEKAELIELLDDYNAGKASENEILYTDLADRVVGMVGGIMDGITLVLIAFAATSLVVSFIMIAIITYISVLERTKEIGILKALGARKKDITRVFNAETFIIGACSGFLGIVIAMLLAIPINSVIYNMTELSNVANLKILHAVILLVVSITLTILGGWIPAKMASKKDAVEALRSE